MQQAFDRLAHDEGTTLRLLRRERRQAGGLGRPGTASEQLHSTPSAMRTLLARRSLLRAVAASARRAAPRALA
jgi:hypothetical protein